MTVGQKSLRQRLWDYEEGNDREGDATQRQQHFGSALHPQYYCFREIH